MKKALLGFAFLLGAFFIPTSAFAATKTPVCADWTLTTGVTCTADVVTSAQAVATWSATFSYSITNGTTYYYKYDLVHSNGSTGPLNFRGEPSATAYATDDDTGSYSSSFVASSDDTAVQFRYSQAGTKWTGTISNVCISDSPTGCSGGGGGGGSSSFAGMYATSTALSQFSVIATDTGVLVGYGVLAILTAILSLMAIGYFRRKVAGYATGRKF